MANSRKLSIALIQMSVGQHLNENLRRAEERIKVAMCKKKDKKLDLVALPECFNSPYGIHHFEKYAEKIPEGRTCKLLSDMARKYKIYIVGGTIPEKENGNIYNSCTVWNREGKYLGKYRKMHLYDMHIPGLVDFQESSVLTAGNELFIFEVDTIKTGIGICYDLRFDELAMLYRQRDCKLLLYPSAFNAATGPLHWELLLRSRALGSQSFMCGISPATNRDGYISYGHSAIIDPWGQVLKMAGEGEEIVYGDLDFKKCDDLREYISTYKHKRKDVYEVIYKKEEEKSASLINASEKELIL